MSELRSERDKAVIQYQHLQCLLIRSTLRGCPSPGVRAPSPWPNSSSIPFPCAGTRTDAGPCSSRDDSLIHVVRVTHFSLLSSVSPFICSSGLLASPSLSLFHLIFLLSLLPHVFSVFPFSLLFLLCLSSTFPSVASHAQELTLFSVIINDLHDIMETNDITQRVSASRSHV